MRKRVVAKAAARPAAIRAVRIRLRGPAASPPDKQWQPGVDRAADANLDYTRKATDLALEHLKDQLADGRDDSELLKQLGWTREEADAFLQRWEAMAASHRHRDRRGTPPAANLHETLRSLGLRPRGRCPFDRAVKQTIAQRASRNLAARHLRQANSEALQSLIPQGTSRGGK